MLDRETQQFYRKFLLLYHGAIIAPWLYIQTVTCGVKGRKCRGLIITFCLKSEPLWFAPWNVITNSVLLSMSGSSETLTIYAKKLYNMWDIVLTASSRLRFSAVGGQDHFFDGSLQLQSCAEGIDQRFGYSGMNW